MKLSADECNIDIASEKRLGDRGHPWHSPDITSNDWNCKCVPSVGASCEAPEVSLLGFAQDYMDENIVQQIPSFDPDIGSPGSMHQDSCRSRCLGPRMGSQVLRAGGDHAVSDSTSNVNAMAPLRRTSADNSIVPARSEVPAIEVLLRTCLDRDKDESAKAMSPHAVTTPVEVFGTRPQRHVQDVVLPGHRGAVGDCIVSQVAQREDCHDFKFQPSNLAQLYLEKAEQPPPSLVAKNAPDVVESPRPKTKVQKKVTPVASSAKPVATVNVDQLAPRSNALDIATSTIIGISDGAKDITNHVLADITDNVKIVADAAQHSGEEITGNAKVCAEEVKHKAEDLLDAAQHSAQELTENIKVCAEEVKHKAEELLDAITHVDNRAVEQEPPVADKPQPPGQRLGSAVTLDKVDSFLTAEQDNIFGFSRSISGFTRENSHQVDICPESGALTMRKAVVDSYDTSYDTSLPMRTILSPDETIVNLRSIRHRQQQETVDSSVARIHRKYADDLESMPEQTYRDFDKLFGLPDK